MANEIHHAIEEPGPCSYLPDQLSSLEQKVLTDVSPEEYEAMMERGWRRFGPVYFRPACQACAQCVTLRIPTATFHPNRSQRRARTACARFRVEVGPPRVDKERLALYHAWHAWREQEREWDASPIGEREYFLQFAFPHPCVREVAWYDDAAEGGPRLVALGICDETPHAWSAVYFFSHPDYAHCSLGTANVVKQVELARQRGIPHVYLGYRVSGCASLRYKAAFRPHELLEGRPGPDEAPRWSSAPESEKDDPSAP
ncbi:arginyltransferase [Hyalangium rubrum]|uniref:Aspartate/glutamate leucyltransferase n=1 Tax=Hyalangium rubrum TaxID=3103134 RepID=A0ABU5HEW3_9BACT|nr:arginyltransferase [Hyalangium sp. s54d21]MDY7231419.1 arginyltransferase [Hyalangium sp. s54d21]